MKKVVILLLTILAFGCSDDDDNGQWTMTFNEKIRNDAESVNRTEKFMFDNDRLIQHIIKQQYFGEETSHEANLSYSDNQVTVTTDGRLTFVYTLNSEGYATQCTYSPSSQNRIYLFSYSTEGYLTGIAESIDGESHSSTSLTYENGDITSISTIRGSVENKFIYEPGEESSTGEESLKYHLPCLGLLETHPLTLHVEALYAGLLGKNPRHFTARSFPAGVNNEQTVYTYEFDKERNPVKMACRTTYAGGKTANYPYTRDVSIFFE